MDKKSTPREIENRISLLEHELARLNSTTEVLKKNEELYRTIVEDIPDLVCRFRPGWEITFVNNEYCRYFEISREKLIGRNFIELINEQDREIATSNILSLSPESPTKTHEHRVIMPDGENRWQQWTNRALFDRNNSITAFQAIGKDITEQKVAQIERERLIEELRQAVENIRTLKGLIPICSRCKKIRDDKGYWNQLERYIQNHADVSFSHGICPTCEKILYGDQDWYKK